MSENGKCPECESDLPSGMGAAPCPGCLMKLGLESWTDRRRGVTTASTTPLGERFVPPDPQELAKLFPQLEIVDLVGKGGMGAVYKARQRGLDRLVAVKILPTEIGTDPAFAERFAREARALARLNHPNIVSVYDYGQTDGLYYFVMEYVDGANLRQLVREQHPDPQQALALVSQICDALQFAHDEGIVHRDIKPENIMVDRRGRAKIADFGLAKLLSKGPAETALTQDRQAMGTLHYMAPEQMEGSKGVDHRADLYSLGVVFYELLTGELPLGRFALPSKTVHVDVRLDEIVLRSLEREPERRYQRASEIKTDIQTVTAPPVMAPVAPQATASPAEVPPPGAAAAAKRLQVPTILLLLAGISNLVPVLLGVLAIPAALLGFFRGGIGPAELMLAGGAVPIAILQIVAALMLRKQQGWGLGMVAGAVSLLPCGVGWLISVIAGVWTLVVLSDPAVKSAFGDGDESTAVSPESGVAVPVGPTTFSRKAIIGALWAPLFLLLVLAIVPAFTLHAAHSGPAASPLATRAIFLIGIGLIALVVGGSSLVGTTILGLLAIRDIRSSGGRIVGLPLALADAMLFPLLLLDVLVAASLMGAMRGIAAVLPVPMWTGVWGILPLIILGCLAINAILVWWAWRSIRPINAPTAAPQWALPGKPAKSLKATESHGEWPEARTGGYAFRIGLVVLAGVMIAGAAVAAGRFREVFPTAANRLIAAVQEGDAAAVDRLLESSPHLLETRGEEHLTPLNFAALNGDTFLVRRLLDRGAEVETVDMFGQTPLIKAAGSGHLAIVSALLERGAEVNHQDEQGRTALMVAAGQGHLPIVVRLLDNGAEIDAVDAEGLPALLYAAVSGRENVVRLLLQRKAEVDPTTKSGATPLIEASLKGYLPVVKTLIEHGADVNHATTFGDTALIWAALKGHEAMVDLLLAHGANLDHRNANGRSAIYFASTDNLFRRLRDAGALVGPPELFREGFQMALAGRYADAAKSFEQARQIDSATANQFEVRMDRWVYDVANPKLTLTVLLADCYARSGEVEKARQILSEGEASPPATSNARLYQRRQNSPGHLITEDYELSRAAFDRFQQSPDEPLTLHLHRREVTELQVGNGVRGSSSESQTTASGAFH